MDLLDAFERVSTKCRVVSPIPFCMTFAADKPTGLFVSAGIHGDEQTNIAAMLDFVSSHREQLEAAPYSSSFAIGNPETVRENRRYKVVDMNRSFGVEGLAQDVLRAKELVYAARKFPYILDLHQTIEPTLRPFGIFPQTPTTEEFFSHLGSITDLIVSTSMSGDASKPVCFDEYMLHTFSACAITVETGSIKGEQQSVVACACEAMKNALTYAKVLDGTVSAVPFRRWHQVQFVHNHADTKIVSGLQNFTQVSEGEEIAYRESEKIRSEHKGIVLFPKYVPTTDRYLARIAIQ